MGNVSAANHVLHFLFGLLSARFSYVTGGFLLYQLVDGAKFGYRVVRTGPRTDDPPMDLLLYALGAVTPRLFQQ